MTKTAPAKSKFINVRISRRAHKALKEVARAERRSLVATVDKLLGV